MPGVSRSWMQLAQNNKKLDNDDEDGLKLE